MSSPFETPKMPEFKANKSGYEIRTEILGLASQLVTSDYQFKLHGWEISTEKDKFGNICTNVQMPEFPGLEKILETAQQMYDFVNAGNPSFKKNTPKK